jgi:hypothetical protein
VVGLHQKQTIFKTVRKYANIQRLKQDEANEEIGKSLSEGTTLFEDNLHCV